MATLDQGKDSSHRYNEHIRLAERYLKFNIEALKAVAASSIGRNKEDVAGISKLAEGGFNRTFAITMQDGLELIARLPYPITVPKRYATASEVATIRFAQLQGCPVPKIYDYSTMSANPVGAEYIIMEKVAGKSLRTCWHSLTENEIAKIISQLVIIEAVLFAVDFPAAGSIYHRHDLDPGTFTVPIPGMSEDSDFCIGPSADASWWLGERTDLVLDRGPFLTTQDTMESVAKREMTWTKQCAKPRFPVTALFREILNHQKVSPTPHIRALSDYLRIANYLVPKEANLNQFVLRHPYLSPNNIFVDESLKVLGVIDWQHSTVLPIFLHVGIPNDIDNSQDKVSWALDKPKLPHDYAALSPEDQESARETYRRRELHYGYYCMTAMLNSNHMAALVAHHGPLRKRLFHRAGTAWECDNVSLKADVIRISRLWKQITSSEDADSPECPLEYSETEIKECFELEKEVREAMEYLERSRDHLGMIEDGCVLPEHYDQIKENCRKFKEQILEFVKTDLAKHDFLHHFPFDDHDESGNT
ncbi:MAG: hypothetical protein Q9215_008106 [Flavoplaca cf. flavocitrina]